MQKTVWRYLCAEKEWANVWNMGGQNDIPSVCRGAILPISLTACGENKPLTPEFLVGEMFNVIVDLGVAEAGVDIEYRAMPATVKLSLTKAADRSLAINFYLKGWDDPANNQVQVHAPSPYGKPTRGPRRNTSNVTELATGQSSNFLSKLPESPMTASGSPAGSSSSHVADAINGKLDLMIGAMSGMKRRLDALESQSAESSGQEPAVSQETM